MVPSADANQDRRALVIASIQLFVMFAANVLFAHFPQELVSSVWMALKFIEPVVIGNIFFNAWEVSDLIIKILSELEWSETHVSPIQK